jgi:RNA polymerase sigma-70 factor (sigma-E family)
MILSAADRGWLTTTWAARRSARRGIPASRAGQDADSAVTALYETHYRSLVRLAALLVPDIATAERVVQDSFVAMHSAWPRLPDADSTLSYLHRSVVDRARSALRQHAAADELADKLAPDLPDTGQQHDSELDRSALVSALRALPPRQHEVLVLRYYADLSEAQIASIMGVSPSMVRGHTVQAMATLRAKLETQANLAR